MLSALANAYIALGAFGMAGRASARKRPGDQHLEHGCQRTMDPGNRATSERSAFPAWPRPKRLEPCLNHRDESETFVLAVALLQTILAGKSSDLVCDANYWP